MKFSIALMLASAAMLPAQENPLSTEAKQAFNTIKNNLIKMAEKMPEDAYSFKPVPEIRTFGGLVGHVADSEMRSCSTVNGEVKQLGASKMTGKAELVAALKSAGEECDKAYGSLTDSAAIQMIEGRGGKRSKLGTLVQNTTHANEEYGYMAVYLRLKGIVPPSSEAR